MGSISARISKRCGMKIFKELKKRGRAIKGEIQALCLACRDPRVSNGVRWLVIALVALALSPIDLIPDFIPVVGLLDDLILLPIGIALVVKMIPVEVMTDCRERARIEPFHVPRKWKKIAAIAVIAVWLLALGTGYHLLFHKGSPP